MTIPDPSREYLRLREEYSRMMDGELEQLAVDEVDLTDEARHALREEISRRGLSTNTGSQLSPSHGFSSPEKLATSNTPTETWEPLSDELYVVRRFMTVSEASMAKGLLESAGIASSIADENMLSANPFMSNVLGGVRLFVNGSDFKEAAKLLDGPILDEIEVEGVGKYVQPRCPRCQSLDITFGQLNNAAKVSLPLGLPMPFGTSNWRCHKCGCQWTDSEQE